MKAYILFLTFLIASQFLTAQSDAQINDWLYGLPINKNPVNLRKQIIKSGHFEEGRNNRHGNQKLSKTMFKGTILTPRLPKNGRLDSTRFSLNIGTLNSLAGYSGRMKWLFFEYFSADTLFLNEVFETACKNLIPGAMEQKPTGHRTLNDEAVGKGINFVYKENVYQLSSISATRVRYKLGAQSFMIIYAGSVK